MMASRLYKPAGITSNGIEDIEIFIVSFGRSSADSERRWLDEILVLTMEKPDHNTHAAD